MNDLWRLVHGRGGVPVAPLLFAPLNGSLTAHDADGDFALTRSGPVRYRDGAAGGYQAALIEELSTNQVPNPYFAVDAAGWTGAARDTGWAYAGPASGLISATGADAEATINATTSVANWILSAIVKNEAASPRTAQLRYNGADVGDPSVIAAGATARLSAGLTGAASVRSFGVRWTDSESGETFRIGHLGVEAHVATYITTPIPEIAADGAIQAGYTWASTPHNSVSTRSVTTLKCAEAGRILPACGSVLAWVYRESDTNLTSPILSVGGRATANKDHFEFYVNANGDSLRMLAQSNSGAFSFATTPDGVVLSGSGFLAYGYWTPESVGVAQGTDAPVVAARLAAVGDLDTADNLTIGSRNNNTGVVVAARIGPLAIFDGLLTPNRRQLLNDAVPAWDWDLLSRAL